MRGAELVLGGLLVTAGLIAPATHAPTLVAIDGPFEGVAEFAEATYSGASRVDSPHSALRVNGPVEAVVAGRFTLEILEETLHRVEGDAGVVTWHYGSGSVSRTTHVTYEHAVLRITGERENLFSAWPNATLPRAEFDLTLDDARERAIFPSWSTTTWATREGTYSHFMEAPLFALGHNGTESPTFELAAADFADLRATGGVQAFVEGDATITVEHAGGVDTYRTKAWGGEPVRAGPIGVTPRESGSYGVITLRGAELVMGFDGVEAIFVSRDVTWTLNGTLAFDANEGGLSAGGVNHTVTGQAVEIVGNTTMNLDAEGLGTTARYLQFVATPSLVPLGEQVTTASFTGDAEAIRVNGAPLRVSAPNGVAEEAKLIAKVLGALVVAWSIARRLVVLALGAFRKDPLAHPRRRAVHAFLRGVGLAHVREIERATRIPVASLSHHLDVLRRVGLVQCAEHGNRRVFYVPSARWSRGEMQRLAVLAHPTRRSLAAALVEAGPMGQHALQDRLGVSRPTVSQQLAPLVEAGLLERRGDRDGEYRAGALLEEWMLALKDPPPRGFTMTYRNHEPEEV